MPAFSEELESEIDAGKIHLGGCCVSEIDPKFYCNDCKKGFATPPLILPGKKEYIEDLRDVIKSVYFSDGGYFGGYQTILFEKRKEKVALSVKTFNPPADLGQGEISEKEWNKMLDKLFCRLYIHEWKKSYVNPDILDGEQWELRLKLTRDRQRNYYGSNAYPPLWKELKGVFRPYFKLFGIEYKSNA